ncbi:MAG: tetratricopeptide repeat protein [Anaerolineae bacterium]|nr:tetratricopeptide repeat protein [Anaerolineae bacterium]
MYVRRDYSRSLYSRNRRSQPRLILILGILIGGLLAYFALEYDDLQQQTMAVFGMEAVPTAFAGEFAQQGAEAFARGDLEAARRFYEQAIRQQPTNVSYLYEYGRILMELGFYSEASLVADQALAADPNDVRAYALKANSLVWSDPGNAIPIAIQGRNLDPNFAPIHAAMAIAYNNMGRYDLALESGYRAIQLDPTDPDTYRAYAWPLIWTGQWQLAIQQLETAISLAPNLTSIYFQLAFEYNQRADNPAMAIAIYEHILEMNPSPADAAKANLRICEIRGNVERANFREAEPYCQRALVIDPNYASAYRQLGRMRYMRRNYEGAIEAFQTCERLGSTEVDCWSFRGLAHFWMGQCDQAWTVLNTAASMAAQQNADPSVVDTINTGIYNVTEKCPGYDALPTPTQVLPTAIPPTPIGGL